MTVANPTIPARTTTAQAPLRAMARRIATVSDQVLVSLTNFGLTLAIGRAFSPEDLASYGIGLSIGLMLQALQRNAIIIPLMLQPGARVMRRRAAIVAEQWIVLCCALVVGAVCLYAAQSLGASRYAHLVVAASVVCLVVYLELEFARAILIKLDRPALLIASALWYAGISAALGISALRRAISYETLLLALGGAMLLHALVIVAVTGAPRPRRGLLLFSFNLRHYGGWAAIATATYSGYNHAPLLALGALAAPIHAAAFVATRSLMQPLQILLRGLDMADKSTFSEKSGQPRGRQAFAFTAKLAAFYALVAGIFGAIAGLFAEPLVRLAYGENFSGFGPALVAWIPVFVLASVTMPFESLVYARRDFRYYYFARGLASILAILLTIPLVIRFTEIGAIAACGVGSLVAAIGTVILLKRGTRS